jgi:hypothetical protein
MTRKRSFSEVTALPHDLALQSGAKISKRQPMSRCRCKQELSGSHFDCVAKGHLWRTYGATAKGYRTPGFTLVSLTGHLATRITVKLVGYRPTFPNLERVQPVAFTNGLYPCAVIRCCARPRSICAITFCRDLRKQSGVAPEWGADVMFVPVKEVLPSLVTHL